MPKKRPANLDLNDPAVVSALRVLEEKGIAVPMPGPEYIKKTFEIEKDLYPLVNVRRAELKLTSRQVVNQAFRLWLSANAKPRA